MLNEEDYAEACRRYKDKRTKLPERQRYHAVILATQGYSYREIGRILLVDEESISQWAALYQATGLDSLNNHPGWGGVIVTTSSDIHASSHLSDEVVTITPTDLPDVCSLSFRILSSNDPHLPRSYPVLECVLDCRSYMVGVVKHLGRVSFLCTPMLVYGCIT